MERAQQFNSVEHAKRRVREKEDADLRRRLPRRVKALFRKHKLTAPDETAEMIVKTIMKSWLKPKPKKQKGKQPSPRERLRTALTHATKLLEYTDTPPSHGNSIAKRSERLRKALGHGDAVIWLAVATPQVDVSKLLSKLDFDRTTLTKLVRALSAALSDKSGARTGRPRGELSRIVQAGCIAWLKAGRRAVYKWDRGTGCLVGQLPKFIRDLVFLCASRRRYLRLTTDAALYAQLEVALPYCERTLKRPAR